MLLPFYGYLLRADAAAATIAPPYDALTPQQRLEHADQHPDNFLNAIRSRQDYPAGQQPELSQLLARNAAWVKDHIDNGTYAWTASKVVLAYRLQSANHSQIGILGEVPIGCYEEGRIKPHERTHTTKQQELVRFIQTIGIMSSPVSCGYRRDARIDDWCAGVADAEPYIDYTEPLHQTRHTIWIVNDPAELARLASYVADINKAYITDGHHRCASLQHFRRADNAAEPRLLTVLFPDHQLRILPFHRYIHGLGGAHPEQLRAAIGKAFEVSLIEDASTPFPHAAHEFTMRLQGRWWRLQLRQPLPDSTPLVEQLAASILQHKILQPLLGISDPRASVRLDYVAGSLDQRELAALPQGDEVLFLLHPPTMRDVMRIADDGQTMPPKSTFFDPKLQSGFIISYPLGTNPAG